MYVCLLVACVLSRLYITSCVYIYNYIQRLVAIDWRAQGIPEALFLGLIRMIDLLQKLDGLKDIKTSLNNDFSRFKR